MKAKEVMNLLSISRSSLYLYTRDKKIKATKLQNGYYDYDKQSVFKLLKKDNRINVIYSRVSTYKQKNDLEKQTDKIKKYCKNNNIKIDIIYSDISSGLDLDRKEFSKLLDDVINYKIKNIYITNKDRLTRLSFRTIKELFKKYDVKIISIYKIDNPSNDNEIFEELISLMHIFSTTLYSKRRKNKLGIYKADIINFIDEEILI